MEKRRIRGWILAVVCAMGVSAQAQQVKMDYKTATMVEQNTAVAAVPEGQYKNMNDTVKRNNERILAAVTLREQMLSMDMQARLNMNGFKRESRAFKRLVYEITYLTQSATLLLNEVSRNPEHSVFVTRQAAKLLLEAKNFVKYAVVVAMNGEVPNPFRLTVEDLEKDLYKVPIYNADAAPDERVDDSYNLLLPDDRIAIMQETRTQLRNIRRAMDQMYWKMKTEFTVRNLIWAASRQDGRRYDRTAYEAEQLKSNINRLGLW